MLQKKQWYYRKVITKKKFAYANIKIKMTSNMFNTWVGKSPNIASTNIPTKNNLSGFNESIQ